MLRNASSFSTQKKIRILFYCAGILGPKVWLYPTVLNFKTFISQLYPEISKNIEWVLPLQLQSSNQQLIDYIKIHNVDILCTSHYIWNHNFLLQQISDIWPNITNVKIIAGGPSIDVNIDNEFFEKYPAIDFAVYGPGEEAFADIIHHLVINKPLIAFNTSNCAWKNKKTGQTIVAKYKFVKMDNTSPYTSNRDFLAAMAIDLAKTNRDVWLPYTITRGCPYTCTFCDWTSGLSTKVSRRKNTYQQEIDLFQELGITNIFLSDANTGQYNEDVDMIEYFAKKNIEENVGFTVKASYSKLRKDNNLKIYRLMADSKLTKHIFSLSIQDLNKTVLKNINRPDVGWDVHVSIANDIRASHPHLVIGAQLIYGLPGQTVESWQQTLEQITKENMLPVAQLNEPLPASPAMTDKQYQEQFKFEYVCSNRRNYSSIIPKKSSSFSELNLCEMHTLASIYTALSNINIGLRAKKLPSVNITETIKTIVASDHYTKFYKNLYHNWVNDNNFFWTVNFDGNHHHTTLFLDKSFLKFIMNTLPIYSRKNFIKYVLSDEFKNLIDSIYLDLD